jgi:hypothetical protein
MDIIGVQGIGLAIMHVYTLLWFVAYAAVFAVGTLWLVALGSLVWGRNVP